METAIVSKRVWIYIINTILYNAIGFAAALPFLLALHIHPVFYVMIGIGFSTLISFDLSFVLMLLTHGYTLASALLKVKYVSSNGTNISKSQILIKSSSESIAILALLDLIYLLVNHTERGVIDRLSDSFAIDTTI